MKRHFFHGILFYVILLSGCGKNGNNPPGGTTKSWLVKDVAQQAGCALGGSGSVLHYTFSYNDKSQIVRLDRTGCSTPDHFEIVYNDQAKILRINYFFGSLSAAPNRIITYDGDFVRTVFPENNDTSNYPGLTYYWNINGDQELDAVHINKTFISSGGTISFYYILKALQSSLTMDDGGRNESSWAFFAINSTGPALSSPFQVKRTPEQKFLYYFLLLSTLGDLNILGNDLPDGIYESYSYSNGNKLPIEHFYNTYALDSNNNVSKIIPFYSVDAPAFGTYTQGKEFDITYEPH